MPSPNFSLETTLRNIHKKMAGKLHVKSVCDEMLQAGIEHSHRDAAIALHLRMWRNHNRIWQRLDEEDQLGLMQAIFALEGGKEAKLFEAAQKDTERKE